MSEKVSRRGYMKYAGAGVVVIAVAGAGAYYATRPGGIAGGAEYDYQTRFYQPQGNTPKERAIDGAKKYAEMVPSVKDHTIIMTSTPGGEGHYRDVYFKDFVEGTGLKYECVTVAWDDILPKYTAESVEHSGAYDVLVLCPQHWLGTFVEKGLALDPFAEPANYYQRYQPGWLTDDSPSPAPPALVEGISSYAGHLYGTVYDYDIWTLHYRDDWFNDSTEKSNFYDKYGYELKPPTTWKEFDDVAEFFTRPPDMYGTWAYAVPFWNKNPLKLYLHSRGVDYFDENMVPLIDTPAGIEAVEKLRKHVEEYSPPEAKSAIWDTAYDFFVKGKCAMQLAWASLKKVTEANGMGDTVKSVIPPGFPTSDGRVRHSAHVGQTHVFFINKYSKHPEAAFAILAYWADPEVSNKVVCDPAGFYEPWRTGAFDDPEVQQSYGGKYYTDVMKEAFDYFTPDYNLVGAPEYDDSLTKHGNAILTGAESSQEGLKAVHDEWEEITERIGRDKQIEAQKYWGPPDHKGFGPKLANLMDPNL